MAMNKEYFQTSAGKLKCISIVLITIVLGIGAASYFTSDYNINRDKIKSLINDEAVNLWREIYFISAVAVLFCCSTINLMLHICSRELYYQRNTAFIDFGYHMLSFAILFTAGGLHAVSAVRIFGIDCTSENECQAFELKLAASGLSLLTSLTYGIVGVVVLTNRRDVERDGFLYEDEVKN